MDNLERIPSGIPGLDKLIEGGLPKTRTFLVAGGTGAGKTIFSMQYLYEGATKYNEPGIYVTLDELPKLVREDMQRFGWDIKRLEDEKKIVIMDASIARVGLPSEEEYSVGDVSFDYKKLLLEIVRVAKSIGAKRIVIDSIATLGMYFDKVDDVRGAVLEMVYILSRLGATSVLVTELEQNTNKYSKYGVEEFVADGVFVLKYLDTGIQGINRTMLIRKMRATEHSAEIHPIEITKDGILIKSIDDYKF
jgi:KaiC/GvpD/RAD55 family RecA-like ATPase